MQVYSIEPEQYRYLDYGDRSEVKILWLDDERDPEDYVPQIAEKVYIKHVTDSLEFLNAIKNGQFKEYNMICMDHDLGSNSKNGETCAKLLKEEIQHEGEFCNLEVVAIHSYNPYGKRRMYNILKELENE